MKFVSTRVITADVEQLVEFYQFVTGVYSNLCNELLSEIV